MKKFIAIFIAMLFVLSVASLTAFAGDITISLDKNGKKISCIDFLDFSESNNAWAKQNADGTWGASDMDMNPLSENNGMVCGAYLTPNFTKSYTNDKLKWSLINGGEVLHIEDISSSKTPGMVFRLDDFALDIQTGIEGNETTSDIGNIEYCKIRIKNYSSADQISFGFTTNNINNGTSFSTVSISNLAIESISGEWVTYVFSMREINSNTNYGESLVLTTDGTPISRWGNKLKDFFIFPFGYNITDGTGAYNGAKMDIDYVVLGSKDYVTNYKSALEEKEDSVSKLEITKAPAKKAYYVGDSIDNTGLELKVTFTDGHSETLSGDDVNVINTIYNFNEETDSSAVTLKYGSASVSYNVKVTGIKDIEIATPATSTTYDKVSVAKSFTPSGLTIKVNYNDGKSAEFGLGAFKLEYDFTELGEQTVFINFYGAKTSFTVNIINVIGIKVAPVEKVLRYGSELADDDFEITCLYSDGSEKSIADAKIAATITKEYAVTKPGTIDVKVTIENITYDISCFATTTATVEAPSSLAVDTENAKVTYNVGETLVPDGLKVTYVYADGTSVPLKTNDFKSRYDFGEPGTKTVTITDNYVNLSATFTATVEGAAITTTAPKQTSTTAEKTPSGGGINPVVIIIIVVVVLVASAVVVVLVLKKKKKN